MKLKLVKKLLITTMAMTMVVGMSVTALAGSSRTTASGNTVSGNTVSGNVAKQPKPVHQEDRNEAIAKEVEEKIKAEYITQKPLK